MRTEKSPRAKNLSIWVALISVYIAWGSTYLAIRFAVQTIPPFLMAAARYLVAGSILYLWRRAAGDAPPAKLEWRSATIIGLLLLVGGNGGVVWAEQRVVSGIAALLIGSEPLWMVLIDHFSPIAALRSGPEMGGGEAPGLLTYLGVALGFLGIAWLVDPFNLAASGLQFDPLGILALLVAAMFWATGSLYSRKAQLPASPLLGSGMEMLTGGAGLLVLGTLTGEWGDLHVSAIAMPSLLGLVYLIVFGSLLGYAAYTWLLRNAPTPLVATYAYVNPLIAIFVGNLLANEPLTLHILIAAGMIVGAVILINLARRRSHKARKSTTVLPSSGND